MNNEIYAQLLLEVMMEKIPIHAQSEAEDTLKKLTKNAFSAYQNASSIIIYTYVTPNRLIIVVNNVPLTLCRHPQEIRGPQITVIDSITEQFAKRHNKNIDDLYVKKIDYKSFWYAKLDSMPIDTQSEISNSIALNILNNMTWCEYMSWNVDLKWIRPARRLVCIFNKSPIIFDWEKANLTSSPHSLYYLNSQEEFIFDSFASYSKLLKEKNIFIDYYDRRNYIENQIKNLAKNCSPKWILNKESYDVIGDVARSTESPIMHLIDQVSTFDLPDEIIKSVLVHHEKLIPSFNDKILSNAFFAYTNKAMQDSGSIFVSDVTKCAEARLKDAQLFWTNDLKISKEEYLEKLKHHMMHKNLGSSYQQIERVKNIAKKFISDTLIFKALDYIKLDLTMQIVYEIPELHGIISGIYAELVHNEDPAIKRIIKEIIHDTDLVNIKNEVAIVALIYRLDFLVGFFGVGVIPKGSSDPFALRRAAFLVIKLGNVIKPNLNQLISMLEGEYKQQEIILKYSSDNLLNFLKDKIKVLLECISTEFGKKFIQHSVTWGEINNLNEFLKYSDSYQALSIFYNRLIGLINLKYLAGVNKLNLTSYVKITDIIKKKSAFDTMTYFNAIMKECTLFFDNIKIIDLDEDSFNKVIEILKAIKFEFDAYCDFRG